MSECDNTWRHRTLHPQALRFAVMTHVGAGNIFVERLIASKLQPIVVVTHDPFFVPPDRRWKLLRWVKRYVQYALHRAQMRHRYRVYFTAKRHRIATLPAQIVNTQQAAQVLQSLNLDYIFVFGFAMLKAMIYTIPQCGTINCHPAYLPRHRGRDPIFWTLKNRDVYTGITYHYIDAGIDTGKVIAQYKVPLCEFDDAGTTAQRLQSIGARKFIELIYRLTLELPIESVVDPELDASYDKPMQRSDRRLDAYLSAHEMLALIGASRDHGNAWLTIDGHEIEVVDAICLPRLLATVTCHRRATFDAFRNIVYPCRDGQVLYLITKVGTSRP